MADPALVAELLRRANLVLKQITRIDPNNRTNDENYLDALSLAQLSTIFRSLGDMDMARVAFDQAVNRVPFLQGREQKTSLSFTLERLRNKTVSPGNHEPLSAEGWRKELARFDLLSSLPDQGSLLLKLVQIAQQMGLVPVGAGSPLPAPAGSVGANLVFAPGRSQGSPLQAEFMKHVATM